ncbi:exo-beta-1,3-glucanase Exg0 [Aspergillus saccharolyticus JOP 1030-1]|uniref:Exo-beta-1,3-glucanase n=1 Tax=Aspergillus saccharolyticus JOP 1030-1 TaxID=1450539 RepID=A0A319AFZ2_9EURO|nr:exo-beta-1,3-glucanase [Aspergillus saccharolyticus JOP 1030-1]PYH45642.1 exo-beta-1,3-glucanase [Aspergillus saccharolyticus JOP 1030-1]
MAVLNTFMMLFAAHLLLLLGLPAGLVSAVPLKSGLEARGELKGRDSSYWVADITRQGSVPFGNSSSYQIFRNVKDFGATGDGSTDDTAAINKAISSGNRCGQGCDSSTTTPALVYFPPGTYVVSTPIIQYYYTQLVGDANDLPVLKAAAGFTGMAVIDADPYTNTGANWYTNQNNFFRAIRNFVIDLTAMPQSSGAGIHWQVGQATSLQNIRFEMIQGGGNANKQQGIFMDNGSGGFMSDLTFNGGNYGAFLGNQQFTTRNLTFNGCNTAIYMNWNWAWTFKSVTINNCGVGLNMSASPSNQTVGSVLMLDSTFSSTPIGIVTAFSSDSIPTGGGALVLDNVDFTGSSVAVASVSGSTILAGGSVIDNYVQGNAYTPSSTLKKRSPAVEVIVQTITQTIEVCPAEYTSTSLASEYHSAATQATVNGADATAATDRLPHTGYSWGSSGSSATGQTWTSAVETAAAQPSSYESGSGAEQSSPAAGSTGSSSQQSAPAGGSSGSASQASSGAQQSSPASGSSGSGSSGSSVQQSSPASGSTGSGSSGSSAQPSSAAGGYSGSSGSSTHVQGSSAAVASSAAATSAHASSGAAASGTCSYKTVTKTRLETTVAAPAKPSALLNSDGSLFEKSKPLYESYSASSFVSVKSAGAKGDGSTDDTAAIQKVLDECTDDQIIYFDHGAYIITDTLKVPKNAKITGEIWPMLMAYGDKFSDAENPIPMLQVGEVGDVGSVEISDLIVETKGPAPGAILIQWNVNAESQGSAGMWDVHARIGGSAGTELQSDTCTKTPDQTTTPDSDCVGAFLLFHATEQSSVYLENTWFWTADHELDLSDHNQINIYNGRGVLLETQESAWLYGTASEHNQLYNYQVASAKNVFMGLIQTETPYYQANPNALTPFTPNSTWNDPDFSYCTTDSCRKAWGLRILDSSETYVYGAGLYSFFDNYSQTCLDTESCQENMVEVDCSDVHIYGLSTKASTNMVTSASGETLVPQEGNESNFCSTIALFEFSSS